MTPAALARLVAFATASVVQTTQDLVGLAAEGLRDAGAGEGVDVQTLAEETLALVGVATARALAVGLREAPAELRDAAAEAVATLPDLMREVFAGLAILADPDTGAALAAASEHDAARLGRKRAFYDAHLAAGQFPADAALAAVLPLWMGRVSGPGLPEPPDARVARLPLAARLGPHLRLVVAYARRAAADAPGA